MKIRLQLQQLIPDFIDLADCLRNLPFGVTDFGLNKPVGNQAVKKEVRKGEKIADIDVDAFYSAYVLKLFFKV